MKNFKSTDTLMALLENGKYKRLVMENDDAEQLDFPAAFEQYKAFVSRPGNYAYLERRQQQADGK